MMEPAMWIGMGLGIFMMFVTIGIVLYMKSTGQLDSEVDSNDRD